METQSSNDVHLYLWLRTLGLHETSLVSLSELIERDYISLRVCGIRNLSSWGQIEQLIKHVDKYGYGPRPIAITQW